MQRSRLHKAMFALFLVSAFVFAMPAQAALNPGQANAIVLLLMSFGADDKTIANVWKALTGNAAVGSVSTNSGSLSFVEATRPDNVSVMPGATSTPFTTFSLTNSTNAPATVYSITVEQTGKGRDSNVESVMIIGSNISNPSSVLVTGGQVDIDTQLTLAPGQSVTLTVAANIAPKAKAGQKVQLEVVAINASVPIKGDLPILGSTRSIKRSR